MNIKKAGEALTDASSGELARVNAFAKTDLKADEVYTFSVLLCDNEVDRDFERFTESTLAELKELFVGKTGINDHEWSTGGQKARIYRTELITDPARKNTLGMPYMYLKGYAYMLRTESNAEIIAEIEGGIKKETSVGCAVASSVCSICGEEIDGDACGHVKGTEYDGKLCYADLTGAVDAYEWSFVAVPAQKNSGVIKKYDVSKGLAGFVGSEDGRVFAKELHQLQKDAALGRKYMDSMRREVLRLALLCDSDLHGALTGSVGTMDEGQLSSLQKSFEGRLAEKFPPVTQLPGKMEITALSSDEYKI